jgi:hypothetical protein
MLLGCVLKFNVDVLLLHAICRLYTAPDTQAAGMSCSANGTAQLAKIIRYSLGSPWYDVPATSATFTVLDDLCVQQQSASKFGVVKCSLSSV